MANKDAYSFYSRCKAATEQGLADIGYADTIVFRPGFLRNTNRLVFRPVETIAGCVCVVDCMIALVMNCDEQADIRRTFAVHG
jgi:hypothetical protein